MLIWVTSVLAGYSEAEGVKKCGVSVIHENSISLNNSNKTIFQHEHLGLELGVDQRFC